MLSKIEWACSLNAIKLEQIRIYEGCLRIIEHTNLAYVEPHRVIIKNITFLVFNYSNDVYISNLSKKIKLSELEEYLKKI